MVVAVGVPAAAWALDRLGERLESSRGDDLLTRVVRTGSAALHRQERGPAAWRGSGGGGSAAPEGAPDGDR